MMLPATCQNVNFACDIEVLMQMADLSQNLRECQDQLHSTKELHAALRGRVDRDARRIQVRGLSC